PTALTPSTPLFCFFHDTSTTDIYTLSLHDALPISKKGVPLVPLFIHFHSVTDDHVVDPRMGRLSHLRPLAHNFQIFRKGSFPRQDRKSTRLNSSHVKISYAVFCLKKKKKTQKNIHK